MSISQKAAIFAARVVGASGAYNNGLVPNPIQTGPFVESVTNARTGAGVYTLTFASAHPITEYRYQGGIEGGAADSNFNFSVAGNVLTVRTSVAAVATDLDFWVEIEPYI